MARFQSGILNPKHLMGCRYESGERVPMPNQSFALVVIDFVGAAAAAPPNARGTDLR